MPTKFTRTNFGTGAYVPLDTTINGRCTVTFVNATSVVCRFAGEADTAPAAGTTNYAAVASVSNAVWRITCNPAKTWILAGSGGGTLEMMIDY